MILIKMPSKVLATRELERDHLCLDIRLPEGDHTSRNASLKLGERTPWHSAAPPTSQHLHCYFWETEASSHPLLPNH